MLYGNFLLLSLLHRCLYPLLLHLLIIILLTRKFVHATNCYIFVKFPSTNCYIVITYPSTNCYIFITLPFSFCMPLIATFASHVLWVGEVLDQNLFRVIVGSQVCDLGIRITWMQVFRLPMLHLDNDKWKCTMFTNKSYI